MVKTTWKGKGASRECVKWVANRQARRVPLFVIGQTKLDTKLAIVAKYGHGAVFEKLGEKRAKITPGADAPKRKHSKKKAKAAKVAQQAASHASAA